MKRPLFLLRLGALALVAVLPQAALAEPYPLEIRHAFGTTVLTEKPVRIATVAWSNHEVPLALGVVPVGFARANFGDDDGDGILPWVEARLAELGAPPPVLFDEGDGIDFEAVAATEPDVILAAYSGLSAQDYATLSRIAPVVAYPQAPWTTDWRQMIALNSAGMGMAAEGQALIARLDARIAKTRAEHPEFAGKTAMFVTHLAPQDLSRIGFYTDRDARVQFFRDLGFDAPQMVREAAAGGAFSAEVSAELIDSLADVDVLVTYGGAALRDSLSSDLLTAQLPAVRRGALVMLDNDPMGTAANPTPMSLPWVLEAYADRLSAAVTAGR
ncbi:iron-siderophore ABC transporter substrate-binding protein [Rhodobacter capsulatus]|uniref:iron-siderophore ABC transporter substrate-binding protein n=1 Tax=Rhodobacter capsulatus TaxID=1061 RepID=UPI0003D34FA6|nr:iron-siderophore ABC transporter substrate-binding protein [Rhodobacter capsulatus]ETD90837.1 ABC transporter substrate-binding protein [Rhodobacter capsulatus YW2]